MADRYPLIANSSVDQIQELASGDNIDLTGNNIVGVVGVNASGIITATSFSGNVTGNVTGNASGSSGSCSGNAATATLASGLTNTPDITITNLVGVAATFSGVVTYEDVTNVDSVGIVTAGTGVRVTDGGLVVTAGVSTFVGFSTFKNDVYVAGVVTATKFIGDGSELTNVVATSGGAIGIQSGSTYIGSGVTALNISQTGSLTISPVSSGFATVSLPAPGVSLGLAIALGG